MRLTLILLLAFAASSVEAQPADSLRAAEDFVTAAQSYQSLYMAGEDDDCGEIIETLADDLVFQENGTVWTKAQMEQFCPHLPRKDVIDTVSSHKLLTDDLAYDFVSQLYWGHNREDKFRETTSRVWRRSGDEWKIVHMDAVRGQVIDDN